jgi:DNA-binding NtrC family response regulator
MMRELQNVIERAIILLPRATLRLALDELQLNRPGAASRARVRTLEEVEREPILQVLRTLTG